MEEIYSAVIVITLILLILSGGIVFAIVNYKDKQLKFLKEKKAMEEAFNHQLLQSRIEVQERTLAALSKDLHDNIGQLLSSAKMYIGIARRSREAFAEPLRLSEETVSQAIVELRSLAKSLDHEWLERFDLLTNLHTEVQRLNDSGILKVTFNSSELIPIGSDQQLILFRIIQEAIQNAVRHSKAKKIKIDLVREEETFRIIIEDKGQGISPKDTMGMGMYNMKQRTELLDGQIEWVSLGKGTCVNIQIPIKEQQDGD